MTERQLRDIGVEAGDVLLVHTAFSKVAPLDGGPTGLIAALRGAIGPAGTLVMPSMTDDDDVPFDPASSSCRWLGVVADTFWRMDGVLRSDSPHAFAAVGPNAPEILAPHPVDVPHGPDSPAGRVHDLDGRILLLGVGHSENTTIHLAEAIAGVRYRRRAHATVRGRGRVDYGEIDHCCERFALVDGWLDERKLQNRGSVGRAESRLVRSRDVVEAVLPRLAADETVFLHPPGVDPECDEARASLEA